MDTLVNNTYTLMGYNYKEGWTRTAYYGCTPKYFAGFFDKLNTSDILKNLGDGFTDKYQFFRSVKVYPFNVLNAVDPDPIYKFIVGNCNVVYGDGGYTGHGRNLIKLLSITKYFNFATAINNFTDVEPYTQCQCFLPYVGYVQVDMSELRASNGQLRIDLVIDVISGNGSYSFCRWDTKNAQWYNFYTTQTNFALDIPLGATDTARQLQSRFNASVQGLTSIGTTALGVATGSGFMTAQGISGLSSSMLGLINSNNQKLIQRGCLGNYPTSYNNPHAIYFIIKKQKINDYDSFKNVFGKPLHTTKKLSTISGLTVIPNPVITIDNITKEEEDLLKQKMIEGIII